MAMIVVFMMMLFMMMLFMMMIILLLPLMSLMLFWLLLLLLMSITPLKLCLFPITYLKKAVIIASFLICFLSLHELYKYTFPDSTCMYHEFYISLSS